jgi:hypothetical protein
VFEAPREPRLRHGVRGAAPGPSGRGGGAGRETEGGLGGGIQGNGRSVWWGGWGLPAAAVRVLPRTASSGSGTPTLPPPRRSPRRPPERPEPRSVRPGSGRHGAAGLGHGEADSDRRYRPGPAPRDLYPGGRRRASRHGAPGRRGAFRPRTPPRGGRCPRSRRGDRWEGKGVGGSAKKVRIGAGASER